jgi:hypothetical protein
MRPGRNSDLCFLQEIHKTSSRAVEPPGVRGAEAPSQAPGRARKPATPKPRPGRKSQAARISPNGVAWAAGTRLHSLPSPVCDHGQVGPAITAPCHHALRRL